MKSIRQILLKRMWMYLSYFILAGDYFRLRRQVGGFIRRKDHQAPRRRALFISLNDGMSQFKVEMFMAKALQLLGVEPCVVVYKSQRVSPAYFRLFGVDRILRLEDYAAPEDGAGHAELPLPSPLTFTALNALKMEGARLGQHILSTYIAMRQNSRVDPGTPKFDLYVRREYQKGLRSIRAINRLYDAVRPDLVVFLEKGYLPYALFFDLALGRALNVIQWCSALATDAYALKRYTTANQKSHPYSLSAKSWQKVKESVVSNGSEHEVLDILRRRYVDEGYFNRNRLRAKTVLRTPDELRKMLGLDPGKNTVVIFSHMLWDATYFYGNNLFDDYEQWLIETVRTAASNDRVNWIVKLHPDYLWKLIMGGGELHEKGIFKQVLGELPPHIKLLMPDADVNNYSLFGVADFCVTVRGTMGIETACMGIPVITAGTGRYSHMGFTIDPSTREHYLKLISELPNIPAMTEDQIHMARKFAYALFNWRPLRFQNLKSNFRALSQVRHPLYMNYQYGFHTWDEMKRAPDMNAFAEWAMNSTDEDYFSLQGDVTC